MCMDDVLFMFSDLLEEIFKIYQSDDHLFNCMSDAIKKAYEVALPKGYNGESIVKYKSMPEAEYDQVNCYYSLKVKINEYNVGQKIIFETRRLAKEYGIEDQKRLASYVTLDKALTTIEKFYEFFLSNGMCIDIPYPQVAFTYYNCFFRRELPMKAWPIYKDLKNSEANPANRNAKIASYGTMEKIAANKDGDEKIRAMYEDMIYNQELIGYEDNEKGAMYNYLEQLDSRVLDFFINMNQECIIPEEIRVTYGLPITKESLEMVRSRVNKKA